MARRDTNFDDRAQQFEEEIYGSSKGYIRLNVLWEDLLTEVPQIKRGGLRILDAGGGTGHVAIHLAKLGNHIVLCDPSQEMLGIASKVIAKEKLSGALTLVQCSIQDLDTSVKGKFDLVICHAVLEWLANPKEVLGHLVRFIGPKGRLSLLFYNRNAAVLKRAIEGKFPAALAIHQSTASVSQADAAIPLDGQEVSRWLRQLGLRIISKSGIRIFHDHVSAQLTPERLEELLKIELALRKYEPFASIAQHVHLVCKRAK